MSGEIDVSAASPEPGETKAERISLLAGRVEGCTACSLASTRTKVVFGEGNPEAPLVFIGEGPGQTEDETGRPFVGRSGELLDECMQECGISRKHVFICNVLRCRACYLANGRVNNRAPLPAEISTCTPWLTETLLIIQPLVVVSLGAASAGLIIHPEFRMGAERGRWFESTFAPHAIASWHPSYILRQEGKAYASARQNLVDDIEAARRKVIELRRALKLKSGTAG